MKKIAFWAPYFKKVGTIKATIHSAKSLRKYGNYDIDLIKVYKEWEEYKDFNIIDFGLQKVFPKLPLNDLGYRFSMLLIILFSLPKLVSYFNKKKPDVVFSYLQGVTPLLAKCLSHHKFKLIVSIQGLPSFLAKEETIKTYPVYKKIENEIRKFVWKRLYKNADYIITLTENTKINLEKFLNTKNIKYIPNPIINEEEILRKANEPLKDELFIKNEYILGVGRLSVQKDFATLIKAFKIVSEKFPDLKLIILGEGELKKKLERLIDELELINRVILYGFVDNPFNILKNAKVFVLSSLWEDQGHALVEAAYLKIPCVSTKCPSGQEELLSYGKAGYLCNIGDENDMADKIIQALKNDNKEKIELAYKNSLQFTDKGFYKNIKGLI